MLLTGQFYAQLAPNTGPLVFNSLGKYREKRKGEPKQKGIEEKQKMKRKERVKREEEKKRYQNLIFSFTVMIDSGRSAVELELIDMPGAFDPFITARAPWW